MQWYIWHGRVLGISAGQYEHHNTVPEYSRPIRYKKYDFNVCLLIFGLDIKIKYHFWLVENLTKTCLPNGFWEGYEKDKHAGYTDFKVCYTERVLKDINSDNANEVRLFFFLNSFTFKYRLIFFVLLLLLFLQIRKMKLFIK